MSWYNPEHMAIEYFPPDLEDMKYRQAAKFPSLCTIIDLPAGDFQTFRGRLGPVRTTARRFDRQYPGCIIRIRQDDGTFSFVPQMPKTTELLEEAIVSAEQSSLTTPIVGNVYINSEGNVQTHEDFLNEVLVFAFTSLDALKEDAMVTMYRECRRRGESLVGFLEALQDAKKMTPKIYERLVQLEGELTRQDALPGNTRDRSTGEILFPDRFSGSLRLIPPTEEIQQFLEEDSFLDTTERLQNPSQPTETPRRILFNRSDSRQLAKIVDLNKARTERRPE